MTQAQESARSPNSKWAFDTFNSYSFERRLFLTFSTVCATRVELAAKAILCRAGESLTVSHLHRCCAVRAIALT
jgi:hypothetical protein